MKSGMLETRVFPRAKSCLQGLYPTMAPRTPKCHLLCSLGWGIRVRGGTCWLWRNRCLLSAPQWVAPLLQPRKAEMLWEGKVPHHGLLMEHPQSTLFLCVVS